MNRDNKLFVAIVVLICLVLLLIGLSIKRSDEQGRALNQALETIRTYQQMFDALPAQPTVDMPVANVAPLRGQAGGDGRDGVNGRDGMDGKNGVDGSAGATGQNGRDGQDGKSAYESAVDEGFRGSVKDWLESLKLKGDKGDPAPALKLDCISGLIMKQYEGDSLWEPTKIKCEVAE